MMSASGCLCSPDVADYVLRVDGENAIVVEAKKLGAPLGPQVAAQLTAERVRPRGSGGGS